MRVLLAEDDALLARRLQTLLEDAGYVVIHSAEGRDAEYQGQIEDIAAAVVDLGLPGLDGLSVIERWRQAGRDFPVLVLTARARWHDKLAGFDAGADDYLTKPFSYIELLARIKSLLRRVPHLEQEAYQVSDLVLNRLKHEVYRNGQKIDLSQKEFALLQLLMEHQGQVMTRSQIASMVWNINFNTDTNVVDVAIRRLRSKIDDHYTPKLIHTVRGMGYKLDECP